MWIVDMYGDYVEAFFTSAGELVDATGDYLYTEGNEVYNAVGEWVGTIYSESGEFIEDTRDLIVKEAGDVGAVAAITGGLVLMFGLFLIYKVVK